MGEEGSAIPDNFIQLPPNSTGVRQRTFKRGALTDDPHDMYVIPTSPRIVSNEVKFTSWRTVASAATPHNLLSIENTTGSAVLVAVRELAVEIQVNAVTAMLVAADVKLFRGTTVPTGGTVLTQHQLDTADTVSPANVVVRGATASDGGAATAITYALPATNPMYAQSVSKILTGVGQWVTDDQRFIQRDEDPLILRAGQSLLLVVVGIVPAHYFYTAKGKLEIFLV